MFTQRGDIWVEFLQIFLEHNNRGTILVLSVLCTFCFIFGNEMIHPLSCDAQHVSIKQGHTHNVRTKQDSF
jgi:hypothetical protein